MFSKYEISRDRTTLITTLTQPLLPPPAIQTPAASMAATWLLPLWDSGIKVKSESSFQMCLLSLHSTSTKNSLYSDFLKGLDEFLNAWLRGKDLGPQLGVMGMDCTQETHSHL